MLQDSPTLTTASTLTSTIYSCITRTAVKQLKPHIFCTVNINRAYIKKQSLLMPVSPRQNSRNRFAKILADQLEEVNGNINKLFKPFNAIFIHPYHLTSA